MSGSSYGDIPFADELKALIEQLETSMETLIASLDTTIDSLETTIDGLKSDLEGYGFDFLFKQWDFIASDTLLQSNDSQVPFSGGTWQKTKQFTFNPTSTLAVNEGGFRFKWKIERHVEHVFFSYIKKNGENWGVEKQTSQGTGWQQFSEDLTGAVPGDTLELWTYPSGGIGTGQLKDYRCYGDTEAIYYLEPTWSE